MKTATNSDTYFICLDEALFYYLLPMAGQHGMSVNEFIDQLLVDKDEPSRYLLPAGGLGNLCKRPRSTKSVRVTGKLYHALRAIQKMFKMSGVAIDLTSILSYEIVGALNDDGSIPLKMTTGREFPKYYFPMFLSEFEDSGDIVFYRNQTDRWTFTDWESVAAFSCRS